MVYIPDKRPRKKQPDRAPEPTKTEAIDIEFQSLCHQENQLVLDASHALGEYLLSNIETARKIGVSRQALETDVLCTCERWMLAIDHWCLESRGFWCDSIELMRELKKAAQ